MRILLIEDDAAEAALVEERLRAAGVQGTIRRVDSSADLDAELSGYSPDLVLCAYTLPGYDRRALEVQVRAVAPEMGVRDDVPPGSGAAEVRRIVRRCDPHVPFLFVAPA